MFSLKNITQQKKKKVFLDAETTKIRYTYTVNNDLASRVRQQID